MTSPSHELCRCLGQRLERPPRVVRFHRDRQDTAAAGWQRLIEMIEEAAEDRREEFSPLSELSPEHRRQIITLPHAIGKLTTVRHLVLYGPTLGQLTQHADLPGGNFIVAGTAPESDRWQAASRRLPGSWINELATLP